MEIETTKILGGIGALLMFIGIIPYINSFGIIGLIGVGEVQHAGCKR